MRILELTLLKGIYPTSTPAKALGSLEWDRLILLKLVIETNHWEHHFYCGADRRWTKEKDKLSFFKRLTNFAEFHLYSDKRNLMRMRVIRYLRSKKHLNFL